MSDRTATAYTAAPQDMNAELLLLVVCGLLRQNNIPTYLEQKDAFSQTDPNVENHGVKITVELFDNEAPAHEHVKEGPNE